MADALLEVVLTELSSLIKGELGLVIGFKKEFEKLSSTISTIQCVLEDAQMKQLKDKTLENWLKKLNAAAYEVDDIVDECKTEAIRFKQSRLRSHHPGIMTFRYKMGKRMKEVMEKLDSIAEERRKFHLHEGTAEKLNAFAGPETGPVLTEKEVFGREKEENDIMKILLTEFSNSEELSVLPVVGMGGLGKTTLAQKIFNDERVTMHFESKIWVCVSDDFDERRLLKKIVECIEGSFADVDDLAPLQMKVQKLLTKQRYFLVLDDVWNEDQFKWAKLKAVLNVGAKGASVLVTTRGHIVGSIFQTLTTYQLSGLSEDDCWLVFKECATLGQEREMDPNLVAIGKEIVKKCGGVPLAAKSLGSLLRFKREESVWKNVRDSEIWDLTQDETSILPALRLSYHHLPLHLRQCFTYCAVFPKDTKMEKNELISLWMAHGFLSSKGKLELEDVGDEVWNELYQRSFFQDVEVVVYAFGKTYTYFKMHDLIHDLATLLMSTNSSNRKIRQVTVRNQSIDGFSEVASSYIPSLLKGYASLRVLNMGSLVLKQLPSSIGDLIHLRLLDLSWNDIKTLPKRLCNLQNLQSLNLGGCESLSCLPKQISKLSSLRVLLLTYCHSLNFLPPRIGELTCLKNLDYFVVGEREGSQLGELQNLDLHGSLFIAHLERVKNNMDAKEASLSSKENLSSLSMLWEWRNECESEAANKVLEALAPHPNLKFLQIGGFGGSHFPGWMNGSVLKNVVKIQMYNCFTNCMELPPFGELPCLQILHLLSHGHANVEYVEDFT